MADSNYNTVDPATGSKTYNGPSVLTKGNHNNMPSRTDAYLPTDERGHIQASSLGGSNKADNIAPQAKDLNHGDYYNMEGAERDALRSGSTIASEKTAFSSNQPGNRPDAFLVNDTITFESGQTQEVHLSFANMQNSEQEAINEEINVQTSDMLDELPNSGDAFRDSMTAEEYADLMEKTEADLPNIADYYAEWDYEDTPGSTAETGEAAADWDGGVSGASVGEGTGEGVSAGDPGSDPGGANPDGSDSGGADPDGSDGGAGASSDDED